MEAYSKEQGLFRTDATPDPAFTDTLQLDLGTVEPTVAGPKRPQDRVALKHAKSSFAKIVAGSTAKHARVQNNGDSFELANGSVVIAAITSCTNTSNPSLMLGAAKLGWDSLSSSEDLRRFRLAEGEPVLVMERSSELDNGRPFEYVRSWYRADRYHFAVRLGPLRS